MPNIPVTKTFLPPFEEYTAQVKRAYEKSWITNRGDLVKELEEKLKNHLGVSNILATSNGTIPIRIALKLLAKGGEVITTPFSYVATTAAIVWENCTPVFVDIHPQYLTIDETKIENAITPRTTAILATHVFGNPCDVEAIEAIARKHKLSVIYDAAHCFGVRYHEQSIFNYGDVSTCSFHATKLFHTGEGGAAFCKNEKLQHKVYYSHNFGHNGPLDFHGLGINAKLSELHAAMGLAVLPHMAEILARRKAVVEQYDQELSSTELRRMKIREGTEWNYSYYPVVFESEAALLKAEAALKANRIVPRRYFYPSLNKLPYVEAERMPKSESISKRILCLPLYVGIDSRTVSKVTRTIHET
jgi:dTDP-4-amino-4,6-dideoxygalactose transaminase